MSEPRSTRRAPAPATTAGAGASSEQLLAFVISSDRGDTATAATIADARLAARTFVLQDGCAEARIESLRGGWLATGCLDAAGRYLLRTLQGRKL